MKICDYYDPLSRIEARMHLKIARNDIKLIPRHGYTLDDSVLLPLQGEHGLIKDDTFIFLRIRPHETLHEVLAGPK